MTLEQEENKLAILQDKVKIYKKQLLETKKQIKEWKI